MHNFSYSKQPAFQEKPEKFKVQLKKNTKIGYLWVKRILQRNGVYNNDISMANAPYLLILSFE